jgi:2-polyprenyl-3-methyl-5-hydroxy-6-metoxy-1,4-benzoquinol methylase
MAVLVRKVRDRFRDLLQTHGSAKTKQRLWDSEFANGRWDCLDSTTEDCVYSRIERWVKGGSILDLGCGSGSTANEMDGDAFSEYTGVDISEVAIVKAQKRTEENGRGHKCRFVQGDVLSYQPSQKFNVILFRDSIYYIKRPQIKTVLTRYAQWLTDGGVFIVRIWNGRGKLWEFVNAIEKNFTIVEKYRDDESGTVVLVFRCRSGLGER